MDKNRIYELIQKYESQKASPAEREELLAWYREIGYQDAEYPDSEAKVGKRIWQRLRNAREEKPRNRRLLLGWWAAAALLFIGIGFYYINVNIGKERVLPSKFVKKDVYPGGNRATLTLSDGRKIELRSDKNAIIVQNGYAAYTDGAQIVHGDKHLPIIDNSNNELSTPAGGIYQIILSDGTKVWLNSLSTLRYPARFSAGKREVEINGEAYFDVAFDSNKSFIVHSRDQQIDVMGTGFNIQAYNEDNQTVTTLVKGSIRVRESRYPMTNPSNDRLLQPGTAAVLNKNRLEVRKANIASAIAWKNGDFVFEMATIKDIMPQLARWYNVDISFRGNIPETPLVSTISRAKKLSAVLEILALNTGVHFKLEDSSLRGKEGRVVVMP